MDAEVAGNVFLAFGKLGAAFAICAAAIGSAMGSGVAGMAAIGSWKRCYVRNRAAPFMLIAFIGLPLTQTIYGMIVMNTILRSVSRGTLSPGLLFGGMAAGVAIGLTSWLKGQIAAAACDAMGETGKGFINYLMVLGVAETVSLFVMVFASRALS